MTAALSVPIQTVGLLVASNVFSRLKIVQEVVTLAVFVPFAVLYMQQPLKLDYL